MARPNGISRQVSETPSLGIDIAVLGDEGTLVINFLIRRIFDVEVFESHIGDIFCFFILSKTCNDARNFGIIGGYFR